MKNTDTSLFELISSLTKSEKRYFQLFATRHFPNHSNYYKLYEAIAAQQSYEEEALKEAFSAGKSTGHFAVLKNQLYAALLESLHHFESYGDAQQILTRGIHYCNMLLNRGLYTACARHLKKYKTQAYALEKFENIIELISIEKRLAARQQYSNHRPEDLEALYQEELNCIHQLQITATYWQKSAVVYKMHVEKQIGPGKDNSALENLIHSPMFADAQQASSFKAKLDRMQIHALYAFAERDAQTAFGWNEAFLHLMDAQPHLKEQYSDRYFATLNNYLIDCLILQRDEALFGGISKLRGLPDQQEFRHIPKLASQVFRMSHLLELNYFLGKEDMEKAALVAKAVQSGLKAHAPFIAKPHIITLQYLCAYSAFCNKQFHECLHILHQMHDMRESESIADLYIDSKMMQLLCHFELGDDLLMDSLMVSFNRLTENKKLRSDTYSVVLRQLKKHIRHPERPLRQKLEQHLIKLSAEPEERKAFNNLNYIFWITRVTHMR